MGVGAKDTAEVTWMMRTGDSSHFQQGGRGAENSAIYRLLGNSTKQGMDLWIKIS